MAYRGRSCWILTGVLTMGLAGAACSPSAHEEPASSVLTGTIENLTVRDYAGGDLYVVGNRFVANTPIRNGTDLWYAANDRARRPIRTPEGISFRDVGLGPNQPNMPPDTVYTAAAPNVGLDDIAVPGLDLLADPARGGA